MTFRLSEEEYERLQVVAVARGVRSISEFVRMAVCWILANCHRYVWDLMSDTVPATGGRTRLRAREGIALGSGEEEDQDMSPEAASRKDAVVLSALKDLNDSITILSRMLEEAKQGGGKAGGEDSQ